MGHHSSRDVYWKLAEKYNTLVVKAPINEGFLKILERLYSPEDARLALRMPWGLNTLGQIAEMTGLEATELERRLDALADRGLILDLMVEGELRYALPPMLVGFFEYTMMRTGPDADTAALARLYHEYLEQDGSYWAVNFGEGMRTSGMRTLPHEETIAARDHTEVLDYDRAVDIIESQTQFGIGVCSCRHEQLHLGHRCRVPLQSCLSFGAMADFTIRHHMARPATRDEVLSTLQLTKRFGLVLNLDNVRTQPGFLCMCCKCCCTALRSINRFRYDNVLVSANYVPELESGRCSGCGACQKRCPVEAIHLEDTAAPGPANRTGKIPRIDAGRCLGCGVCALKCTREALELVNAKRRVHTPEDAFEKIILIALERGTLQYQLFTHPSKLSHKVLRAFVGGFLRLSPMKKALLTDGLRSRFLGALRRARARAEENARPVLIPAESEGSQD